VREAVARVGSVWWHGGDPSIQAETAEVLIGRPTWQSQAACKGFGWRLVGDASVEQRVRLCRLPCAALPAWVMPSTSKPTWPLGAWIDAGPVGRLGSHARSRRRRGTVRTPVEPAGHGTHARYVSGCRCDECRPAATD
jgi:hypothetical protein